MIEECDENGDGEVSWEEFRNFCLTHHKWDDFKGDNFFVANEFQIIFAFSF